MAAGTKKAGMPANGTGEKRRKRVIKPPQIRRSEIIDAAQRLFLGKGYDKTTINDVIAATGLSKGAFYHHFRAKDDLLEAVTERVGGAAIASASSAAANSSLGALARFQAVFDELRAWKLENVAQLRAVFMSMLEPENAVLYYRICNVSVAALAPVLAEIIEQGVREGVFDVVEPRLSADALLWLGIGRRASLLAALNAASSGNLEEATDAIMHRLRAEGRIVDRILGLPPGTVDLAGPPDDLRKLIAEWCRGKKSAGRIARAKPKAPAREIGTR